MRKSTNYLIAFLLAMFVFPATARPAPQVDVKTAQIIDEETEKIRAEVIKVRRFIHMNPELGNREFETAKMISSKLESLGFEVRTGVAGTGVVAVLKGMLPGPAVAVRADMDALPIQEMTSLPYKSLNAGVMHACGHDMHSSIVLGTAMVLSAMKEKIRGSIVFIFQPAEEGAPAGETGGADRMIKEGAIDNPQVSAIFGMHVWPENVGQVLFSPGYITANSDSFKVTIKGKSAHAARPHEGVDAIVIAAEIISTLQTIVSREVDPTDPAVVTIGLISGGSKANIIADKVTFEGTVRTVSETNHKKVQALMESIVGRIAGIYGAVGEVEYKQDLPSVYNHPELAAAMLSTVEKLLGKDKVLPWKPQMIAEDFSLFSQKIPAFYFFLGVKSPAQAAGTPLHNPYFNPDERAIPVGIKTLCHLLLGALDQQNTRGSEPL